MNIQNLDVARIFNISKDKIIVGNGAAELIKELGNILNGKVTINVPTFNEYIRCFKNCEIIESDMSKNNYCFDKKLIIENIIKSDVVVVINPDNPTGSFIDYDDIKDLLDIAQKNNTKLIIDESFIDFVDEQKKYTLINEKILNKYTNLIVIKSMSKSYGIPGIRLGLLASGNKEIINNIKDNISIWNINSIAEYFLQIVDLYSNEYTESCNFIEKAREKMYKQLSEISYLQVYKSQANYFMCKLLDFNSTDFTRYLLKEHDILIKDLKDKKGFKKQNYIRIAIKTEEENNEIIEILKNIRRI